MVAQLQPSSYRQFMAKIAQGLNSHDVNAIKFVAADHLLKSVRDEISDSFQLFEALEERGLLGYGNYSFLIDCLNTTCNQGLIECFRTGVPEISGVPYHPPSFGNAAQWLIPKNGVLRMKHRAYIECMRKIIDPSHYRPLWEERFSVSLDNVVHGFDCDWISESLAETQLQHNKPIAVNAVLDTLPLVVSYATLWPKLVTTFQQSREVVSICEDMSQCRQYCTELNNALDLINWNNKV